ncbi:hypothetical protein FOL47_003513, partial [Perkinsus chesapeaki]
VIAAPLPTPASMGFPGVEETFKILVDIPEGDRPIVFTAYRTGPERTSLGVGVAFEEYVTKAPVGTESFEEYHRLLLLTIGDLKIVVRTEVDAVASDPQNGPLPTDWKLCKKSEKMHYKAYGKFNANETVVEMKSKSAFFPDFPWRSTFYQMLLGKVDKLVLGWHKKGSFEPPKEYTFSEVRKRVDDDVDKRLRQLGALLRRLLEVGKQEDIPKALELSWDGGRADLVVQARKVENSGTAETRRFVESFIE